MNRDIRAALIGGLAATFVVAASLAPKLGSPRDEVAVHNVSAAEDVATETSTSLEPTTETSETSSSSSSSSTTATTAATTTTTTDLPARVGGLEQRVTKLESTTTTTAPAKPEVTFYFEGTRALGPEAAVAPYDGTWKVVFRTSKTAPGLRVRYLARTKTGSAEFVAEFSDQRPMYTHSAIGRIDASLLDVPAAPPEQSGAPLFFEKIVAVEWDGGSQTF